MRIVSTTPPRSPSLGLERLDLVEPRPLLAGQLASEVLVELREDLVGGPERVDAGDPVQPLGVRDREMEREVPAPRMPDRPGFLLPEEVEDRDRVRHMRLDGVGPPTVEGYAPLRIADGREQVPELRGAAAHVVGEPGPPWSRSAGMPVPPKWPCRAPSPVPSSKGVSLIAREIYSARSTAVRPSAVASRAAARSSGSSVERRTPGSVVKRRIWRTPRARSAFRSARPMKRSPTRSGRT